MSDKIEKTKPKEHEVYSKEAYFASLAEWTKQTYQAQEAIAGFSGYLLTKYPHMFYTPFGGQHTDTLGLDQPQPIEAPAAASARDLRQARRRILNRRDQNDLIELHGGPVLILAPLWKRAVAQAIDMYLILMLKVLIALLLVCQFPSIGKELIWRVITDDVVMYYFGVSTSTETLLVRIFLKLIGFCYEPLWTICCDGATPGKWLMEIHIVTACAVMPWADHQEPQFVVAYPGWRLSIKRAIFRSLIKRIVTTIMLPISIGFVFRRHRAYYGIWTNTIVVDANFHDFYYLGERDRPMDDRAL